MEINKILNADILDIIFDGRNKQYGAYELRKTYNGRLTKALLLTAALAIVLFLASVFADIMGKKKVDQIDVLDTQMAEIRMTHRHHRHHHHRQRLHPLPKLTRSSLHLLKL